MKKPGKNPEENLASMQLPELVRQAELFLSHGQPLQALQYAQRCLTLDPQNAELLNFAGVCAIALGDRETAEQFWRWAIALDPRLSGAYFNLGLMLAKGKRGDEAEQCYRQAILFDPQNAEAYCNLGNLLNDRKQEDAEACYRQAIALNPKFSIAHFNLGNVLLDRGRFEEAEQHYREAAALDPANAQAYSKLGFLLARRKRMSEAEQCYRQTIALDPKCSEVYCNLGLLLGESNRFEEAEQCFRQAMAIDPGSTEICSNLGNLLAQTGRENEAEQCYRKAISLNPMSAAAHCNLGVLLATLKRDNEAEECFRNALACNPKHALTQLNLAYLLLSDGRWEEGWAHHEARYAHQVIPDQIPGLSAICPTQWQGESLTGKSLLVLSEQGFGDAIQFSRYLQVLKDQGAAHITLICRSPLKPLFSSLSGVDTLMDVEDTKQGVTPHDYWTLMLSLPFHCKATPQTIPSLTPYLHALPEYLARWSPRLPSDGFRVGLVWKGNPMHSNDANRSLPSLSALAPLWSVAGVRFISLQKGQGEEEAMHPPIGQPILDLGSGIADFADTAATVACLDLVICVDTAIAHLAGALGKPCWVMLPAYKTDYRWMNERNDTPWYPGTVRLFRQQNRGDWTSVVSDIKQALSAVIEGKSG